jgi:hypothetical protein
MRWMLLLLSLVPQPAMTQEPSWAQAQSVPKWAAAVFEHADFRRDYALSVRINPFLLQGDFDGDGQLDVAVLVVHRGSRASGIAVLHAGAKQPILVGAGHSIGDGGDDFSWMDAWSVVSKASVAQRDDGVVPLKLRGDALFVEKLESASAIVYWDGEAYQWYQQGD